MSMLGLAGLYFTALAIEKRWPNICPIPTLISCIPLFGLIGYKMGQAWENDIIMFIFLLVCLMAVIIISYIVQVWEDYYIDYISWKIRNDS